MWADDDYLVIPCKFRGDAIAERCLVAAGRQVFPANTTAIGE